MTRAIPLVYRLHRGRRVAFLLVIPGETPSSGLRRTGVLAPGLPRRGAAREAVLRRTPAELFLVRRLMAVVLFDRWRVFPATAFCVGLTSLVEVPRKRPEK